MRVHTQTRARARTHKHTHTHTYTQLLFLTIWPNTAFQGSLTIKRFSTTTKIYNRYIKYVYIFIWNYILYNLLKQTHTLNLPFFLTCPFSPSRHPFTLWPVFEQCAPHFLFILWLPLKIQNVLQEQGLCTTFSNRTRMHVCNKEWGTKSGTGFIDEFPMLWLPRATHGK